jgi:hypothetical protein
VPTSVAELASVLAGYELHATREARDATRFLLFPPLPLSARGSYAVIAAAAIELLPVRAQVELRLVVPPLVGPMGVRPAARALVGTLRWALGDSPALTAAKARVGAGG